MFERETLPVAGTARRARGMRKRANWPERHLWKALQKLDANFRRQAPIGPYFADFACYGRKLVIEVDGGVHERLETVQSRDAERQRWLEAEGFKIIRFTDRQVSDDVEGCADAIKALLLEGGGWGGGVAAEAAQQAPFGADAQQRPITNATATPPSPALPPSRRKGALNTGSQA